MTLILTAILCITITEILLRSPIQTNFSDIIKISQKALHVLGAKSISDHWKEKAIRAYAIALSLNTLKLFGLLLGLGVIIAISILLSDLVGSPIGGFIISWFGVVFSSVVVTAYFILRKYIA